MTREPECTLTELPVSMCAHCREQREATAPPLVWFTAMYDGRCADCRRPIQAGDEIAATDDGCVCRRCQR